MGAREATVLFGPFVEAPRRDVVRLEPGGRRSSGQGSRPPAAPDDLRLETGVVSRSAAVRRRRSLTTACSVVAHAVGLVAVIAAPLLLTSALPEPAGAVHAFLVDPLVVPPAPPPPPASAPGAKLTRTPPETAPASTTSFTAPIEVPTALAPEEGLDLGFDGGVAGGVEGGVPGGVIGAIVGGLPELAKDPPPPTRVFRVSGLIKEPSKIKHVAPVYPPVAAAGQVEGLVVLEALIDVRGHVASVKVLEGNPLFEGAALEAVRQWVYTPTLLDGVPVAVIMTVTVRFEMAR